MEKGRAEMQFERGGIEKWLGGTQQERAETQFERRGTEKWLEGIQNES